MNRQDNGLYGWIEAFLLVAVVVALGTAAVWALVLVLGALG